MMKVSRLILCERQSPLNIPVDWLPWVRLFLNSAEFPKSMGVSSLGLAACIL